MMEVKDYKNRYKNTFITEKNKINKKIFQAQN